MFENEDEERAYQICRMIVNLCKLANIKAEQVIEMLHAQNALPKDYNMDSFIKELVKTANEPLRRGNKPLVAHIYVNGRHVHKVLAMKGETPEELRRRVDVQVIVTEDF